MTRRRSRFGRRLAAVLVMAAAVWAVAVPAAVLAGDIDAPPSLKVVPVPLPPDIDQYVADRAAAIQLGKALFWDMNVGSDGLTACATCHFKAGADGRERNQLNPGLGHAGDPDGNSVPGDQSFTTGGLNHTLTAADFPFHRRGEPAERQEAVVTFDSNDIVGSQGIALPAPVQGVGGFVDPFFRAYGKNLRQSTGRNAPSAVNAVFSFASFWDGRANNIFNGSSPWGPADPTAGVFVQGTDGKVTFQSVRMLNGALASQALGPPVNTVEMSFPGRTWPDIGRSLLGRRPLSAQVVLPDDSVLGPLAGRLGTPVRGGTPSGAVGLNTTYRAMVEKAFPAKFWASPVTFKPDAQGRMQPVDPASRRTGTGEYSQMETNFALFFGLAVMLYESTLVSDDSRFDRFQEGRAELTEEELEGMEIFFNQGRCSQCHGGSEFSNASTSILTGLFPGVAGEPAVAGLIEAMAMGDGIGLYDAGFYDIAVTPTAADIGRGGVDAFGFPLSFSRLAIEKGAGRLPSYYASAVPDLPPIGAWPTVVDSSFKTPSLRNVELTGPYFHNGGASTLMQVVELYVRGGNFPEENVFTVNPFIKEIGHVRGHPERRRALVAFMLTLTDPRVKDERAPFDHPSLKTPNGYDSQGREILVEIPAVGAGGRQAAGLPPLQPFLGLDPFAS